MIVNKVITVDNVKEVVLNFLKDDSLEVKHLQTLHTMEKWDECGESLTLEITLVPKQSKDNFPI